jgi:hypothetical protein
VDLIRINPSTPSSIGATFQNSNEQMREYVLLSRPFLQPLSKNNTERAFDTNELNVHFLEGIASLD